MKDLATEGDTELAEFFRQQLSNPDLCYSCIIGLLQTIGTEAYPDLVKVAKSRKASPEDKHTAVDSLAEHSGYPVGPSGHRFSTRSPESCCPEDYKQKNRPVGRTRRLGERGISEIQSTGQDGGPEEAAGSHFV